MANTDDKKNFSCNITVQIGEDGAKVAPGPSNTRKRTYPAAASKNRQKASSSATSDAAAYEPQNKKKIPGKAKQPVSVPAKPAKLTCAKKAELKKMTYQFKVSLLGTDIWRRIQVIGRTTFADLLIAIKKCFAWNGDEMHLFKVTNPFSDVLETLTANPFGVQKNEKEAFVFEYFLNPAEKAFLTYGNWEHEILFEKTGIPSTRGSYPRCLGGKMASVPDECDGVEAYRRFLAALDDANHPEFDKWMDWLSDRGIDDFDPAEFTAKNIFKVPKTPKAKPRRRQWLFFPGMF